MLTTLSISLRATTLDPKGKYDRLAVTWRMRTLGMSESFAGAPQIICCLTFGAPDDLSAASKTPCHCPNTKAIADETVEASILCVATAKICSTQKENNIYSETSKLDLILYGSHMVEHLQ